MFEGLENFAQLGSTVVVTLAFLIYLFMEQKKKKENGIQVVKDDKAVIILENELKNYKELAAMTTKTMQNDMHTLSGKFDILSQEVQRLCVQIGQLQTIINERMPKNNQQ